MDNKIEFVRYSPENKKIWDEFVESSKNGTFLFNREYMDYHSDRFEDHSFLIYRKGKLYCLLPANLVVSSNSRDKTLYSHQGLTYGGLIMNDKCSAEGILEVFKELKELLSNEGINKLVYKPVPHIYHRLPSEEDLYALFRNQAPLIVRNISSTINLTDPWKLHKDRREAVRRAKRNGLRVVSTKDYDSFWVILEENLMTTYKATPVHSITEIKKLVQLFPDNIKLWCSFQNERMMAGVVCYYMKETVHAQYISATPEGKKAGAVDLIIEYLIENIRRENSEIRWFDLGTSNEDGGRVLNESLIYQKQGFGGRGVCYDTYEWNINVIK